MKRKFSGSWTIGACILAGLLVGADRWNASVVAQPASEARNGNVRINNDGQTTWDDTRSLGRMLQNVRVTQDGEDFILYCEELNYNRTTNQAIAKGKLRVESRDSTITGNEIRANFNTKMIVVLGNVVMKSHGVEDGIKGAKKSESRVPMREEIKRKASRMVCDRIDYNYQNRQATVTGNIRMVQGKNTGTCERILFDEDKNIAQLISSNAYGVKFTDDKDRTILTREVVVYIDLDHVQTKYPVKIDIPRPRGEGAPPAPQPPVTFPEPERIPENIFGDEPASPTPGAVNDTKTPAQTAPPTAAAEKNSEGKVG